MAQNILQASLVAAALNASPNVSDPLEMYRRDPHETALNNSVAPSNAPLLRFETQSRSVIIAAPIGNIRIELPADTERYDSGASVVVAASAAFNPYESAALRQQMLYLGSNPLEQQCESISCTLICSDISSSGRETLRQQHMVIGSSLFEANHPDYTLPVGPVTLNIVLFGASHTASTEPRSGSRPWRTAA